jgi:hypothetical protein
MVCAEMNPTPRMDDKKNILQGTNDTHAPEDFTHKQTGRNRNNKNTKEKKRHD